MDRLIGIVEAALAAMLLIPSPAQTRGRGQGEGLLPLPLWERPPAAMLLTPVGPTCGRTPFPTHAGHAPSPPATILNPNNHPKIIDPRTATSVRSTHLVPGDRYA
jgi:hypothetical protein